MAPKRATAQSVPTVLRTLAEYLSIQNVQTRQQWAKDVNVWLDALLADDAFGTEGQCDPRGDHRD